MYSCAFLQHILQVSAHGYYQQQTLKFVIDYSNTNSNTKDLRPSVNSHGGRCCGRFKRGCSVSPVDAIAVPGFVLKIKCFSETGASGFQCGMIAGNEPRAIFYIRLIQILYTPYTGIKLKR